MASIRARSDSGKALIVLVLVIPLLAFLLFRSLEMGVQIANVPHVSLQLKQVLQSGGRPGYRTGSDGIVRLNETPIIVGNVNKFNESVRTILDDQNVVHRTATASLEVLMNYVGGGQFTLSSVSQIDDTTLACVPRDVLGESPKIIAGTFQAVLPTAHPAGPMTEAESSEPMRRACLKELESQARLVCYEKLLCYATRTEIRSANSNDDNMITACHCISPNGKDISPQGAANPGSMHSSSSSEASSESSSSISAGSSSVSSSSSEASSSVSDTSSSADSSVVTSDSSSSDGTVEVGTDINVGGGAYQD